ncbi:glycosyltransferase family 2 protein [Pyrobaculum neutrophilum]|uniref:glycosyltransferase family 2 protein n=1 Tax=Pyrobaculum neutrophilum TaxID=70771 RepID=UPI00164F2245|nr:glycosyltransferase family 2 protein [Pyrobaculum neutrophilum]
MKIKIAVVVRAYRRYSYLPQAVESALRQTRRPDAVVVVADDVDKLRGYPVYALETKTDKLGEAVAAGIKAAEGDVVAFLEDDDLFHPEKLQTVERIFTRRRPAALHHMQHYIDEGGNPADQHPAARSYAAGQPPAEVEVGRENIFTLVERYPLLHHNLSSWAAHRDLLQEVIHVLSRLEIMLDFSLLALAAAYGTALHIPNKLTYYRVGGGASHMQGVGDLPKVVCTRNKDAIDAETLLHAVKDKNVRKAVLRNYVDHAKYVYIYNALYKCDKAYKVSTAKLLARLIVAKATKAHPVSWRTIAGIAIAPIVGRRRLAERSLRKMYGAAPS